VIADVGGGGGGCCSQIRRQNKAWALFQYISFKDKRQAKVSLGLEFVCKTGGKKTQRVTKDWRLSKLQFNLLMYRSVYSDKKENKIVLIYKEIQRDGVQSLTNVLLIYGEIFAHFLIY
jgi:hypothetical protein